MSDTTTFGAMLIRLRLHSGYTQKEIAASTGISRSSYCHLEADYRKPTMEFFIKLCIFYKQNPVKLLLPLFPEESMDSQKHYLQYLNSLCEIRYKSDTKRNRKRNVKCWSKKQHQSCSRSEIRLPPVSGSSRMDYSSIFSFASVVARPKPTIPGVL